MAEKINRRQQVIDAITTGEMTKKEIAEQIGVKESGISSQMTYLRWMGYFIIFDDDKKLSFTDEAGFADWEADKKANRKTKSTSTKTPAEQHATLTKTIANQEKAMAKFVDKQTLLADEEDADEDTVNEVDANITLLDIKIRRNEAKLDNIDLSDEPDAEPEPDDEDEELL
jgi:hypothetical protein